MGEGNVAMREGAAEHAPARVATGEELSTPRRMGARSTRSTRSAAATSPEDATVRLLDHLHQSWRESA